MSTREHPAMSPDTSTPWRAADLVTAIGIFVAFSVLYAVSIGVAKRNLEWYNFIMDADPGRVLGDALRGQNLVVLMRHPLFTLTTGAFARALQSFAEPRASVLYATAMLGAGGVAAAFCFFRAIAVSRLPAVLFTMLYGLAATTWVLSSIPETFAISSGLLVIMLWMQRPDFAQPRRFPVRFALNAVVAALAVGVAVPNIVYAALGCANNVRYAQPTTRRRIAVFAAFSAASFVAFVAFGAIQGSLFPSQEGSQAIYGAPIVAAINDPYLRLDRAVHLGEVARLIRAFTFDNLLAANGVAEVVRGPDGPQHMIQYGGRTSPLFVVAGVSLLAFVVALVATGKLRRVAINQRAQVACAIVIYNIIFHFFYRANGQPFIFTIHALFPLLAIVALLFESSTWRHRTAALAAVVVLVSVNNVAFVRFVNRALAAECTQPVGNVCLAWAPPDDTPRLSQGVQEFLASADYPFELGRVAFSLGRFDESIALLRQAVGQDETHVLARLYLGAALIRTNRPDEAIANLTPALARDPWNDDLRRLLTLARQRAESTAARSSLPHVPQ